MNLLQIKAFTNYCCCQFKVLGYEKQSPTRSFPNYATKVCGTKITFTIIYIYTYIYIYIYIYIQILVQVLLLFSPARVASSATAKAGSFKAETQNKRKQSFYPIKWSLSLNIKFRIGPINSRLEQGINNYPKHK